MPANLDAAPRVLVPGYRLTLFAESPQIVTPVAICFDHDGQLLAIESHTHQRASDYEGPQHDRILRLIDRDRDGRADQITTFYDKSTQTMSIAPGPDRWIYVATRREIFRLRDADRDGMADERHTVVRLETRGDYPHNGLAGLVFSPTGELFFGMGENLGEPYRLIGSDLSSVSDEKEGGNIFRCSADGAQLTRYATGFWNPFGNTFDSSGRLYSVDNDPDASPPCRLLHVVPGADFGYQFRYGRSGRHPLQAWDAELPGTLPMAAGTGEAPCQIVPFRGRLWVTSWGDYRIEAFAMYAHGASVQGQAEVIVQGDQTFRPVGLAIAPDGALAISDWVDRSYPVHGQGRIWRLEPTAPQVETLELPAPSREEASAQQLRHSPTREALDSDDPYVRQAAAFGWSQSASVTTLAWDTLQTPRQRIGMLAARRWRDPKLAETWISMALADQSDEVRLMALRVIGERQLTEHQASLNELLRSDAANNSRLGTALLATLAWLESSGDVKDPGAIHQRLAEILNDSSTSLTLRQLALRHLPADHPAVQTAQLGSLQTTQPDLSRTIVQVLVDRNDAAASELLAQFATDTRLSPAVRADAIAGLAGQRDNYRGLLTELTERDGIDPGLAREAARVLGREAPLGESVAQQWLADADATWALDGNADAGRRVFFRATGARCSVCHQMSGRGGVIGPELTTISRRGDANWLLQTILDPNRDVAPKYAGLTVVTRDGRTWTGLPLAGPGDDGQEVLVQTDGTHVTIPLDQIEQRYPHGQSIMPSGLANVLSASELKDLVAFLQNP
jgi:putative membrane-bound dehydrogenase-like protein